MGLDSSKIKGHNHWFLVCINYDTTTTKYEPMITQEYLTSGGINIVW